SPLRAATTPRLAPGTPRRRSPTKAHSNASLPRSTTASLTARSPPPPVATGWRMWRCARRSSNATGAAGRCTIRPTLPGSSRRWPDERGRDAMSAASYPQGITVANAPVSYGAFELTVGRDPNVPDGLRVLDQVAGAGYAGIDLGPVGYLGTGEELAD